MLNFVLKLMNCAFKMMNFCIKFDEFCIKIDDCSESPCNVSPRRYVLQIAI